MLDLQAEQHDAGQSCLELYEAVAGLKRRHDLHPCAVRPRDGLSLRRDSEREVVQDLVKRFRDLPSNQRLRRYLARAWAWPQLSFEPELERLESFVFFPAASSAAFK